MSDPYLQPGPSARQWEAHVRQMVLKGVGREQILYDMSNANWPYPDAIAMIQRIASKERTKAIWMIVGGGLVGAVAIVGSIISLLSPQGGVIAYGPAIVGVAIAVYGLTRIARIRA